MNTENVVRTKYKAQVQAHSVYWRFHLNFYYYVLTMSYLVHSPYQWRPYTKLYIFQSQTIFRNAICNKQPNEIMIHLICIVILPL